MKSTGNTAFEDKDEQISVDQLRNENQLLKTEVQALTTEIQLLKDQIQMAMESWKKELDPAKLPDIVLRQIFENLTDTSTLLSCRAVCSSWKAVIDNTTNLMRRLTVRIPHPLAFLQPTNNVPVMPLFRVRSIKFEHVLPSTEEEIQNLIEEIAPTLESVAFDFDGTRSPFINEDQCRRLTTSVLRQCTRLNEVRLQGRQKNFMRGLNITEPVFANITSLFINALDENNLVSSIFSEVILSLSRLSTLALLCHLTVDWSRSRDYVPVLTPVCQHMVRYPGILKKLVYGQDNFEWKCSGESGAMWIKLLLMAGRQDVVVTTDVPFDLHNLVIFKETDEHQVNLKNCSAVTQGRLSNFSPNSVNQHRIEFCVNLEELEVFVKVNDEPTRDQLRVLWRLNKLRKLTWRGLRTELPWSTTTRLLQHVFSRGLALATVRTLIFEDEPFDSNEMFFSSLHVYFPNLVHLRLCRTTVPNDLFDTLTKVEGLVTLELMSIPGLLNTAFLARKAKAEIPAFVRLAKLRALTICKCRHLTERCLQNAILLNPTLEKLSLLDCKGFTAAVGYMAIITNGRLKKCIPVQGRHSGFTFTLP